MGSIHNLDVPILFFSELLCNAESKTKVFSVGMDLFALYMAELL